MSQDQMLKEFREFLDQDGCLKDSGIYFVERDDLDWWNDCSTRRRDEGEKNTPSPNGVQPRQQPNSQGNSQTQGSTGQLRTLLPQELAALLRTATIAFRPGSSEVTQVSVWDDKVVKSVDLSKTLAVGQLNDFYGNGIRIDPASEPMTQG